MELIDRDALKKNLDTALEERRQGKNVIRQARMNVLCSFTKEALDAMPTIDPVKRGKWIGSDDFDEYYRCSECGKGETQFGGLYRYCPWCGAIMEGEEDEERLDATEQG